MTETVVFITGPRLPVGLPSFGLAAFASDDRVGWQGTLVLKGNLLREERIYTFGLMALLGLGILAAPGLVGRYLTMAREFYAFVLVALSVGAAWLRKEDEMASTIHGVLVGFDGSPASEEAVDWGMSEALVRGDLLTVCHAWLPGYQSPAANVDVQEYAKREAERVLAAGTLLAQTLAKKAAAGPGEVRSLLATGPAAEVLCEQSSRASMLVVGGRGHSGLPGLLLGSVSSQAPAHAQGPVVVVRGQWRRVPSRMPAPIVVGADGSSAAEPAVEFAFGEAAAHGVPLITVCAMADSPETLGAAHQIAEDFQQQIDRWEKEYPAVLVRRCVRAGSARTALLEAAREASQLVVVGARGRGGLAGMTLGSVSQALLHHAPCPVTIVHPHPVHPHPGDADNHRSAGNERSKAPIAGMPY